MHPHSQDFRSAGVLRREKPIILVVDDVALIRSAVVGILDRAGLLELASQLTDRPIVDCDRKRVLQILSNLIGNALKVTPPAGTVSVRAEAAGDRIVIAVSDTGPGIDAADVPHLFDRYWKGHVSNGGGAGLGLFIVEGLVEAHGGSLAVDSQPGVGSTFSFSLPLHRPLPS